MILFTRNRNQDCFGLYFLVFSSLVILAAILIYCLLSGRSRHIRNFDSCRRPKDYSALMATMENAPGVSRKVLVSDIPAHVTNEFFIYFFEVAITDCNIINCQLHRGQNNAFVVTFETAVDVANLQQKCKECPFQGHVLQVQPVEEHTGGVECSQLSKEVVVSGIADNVTEDYLTNWLECQLDGECIVEDIITGCRKNVVLVVFDKPVDLVKLQKVCDDTALEGRHLQIKSVDARGAILICNPHPETQTKSFEFYLRNTRRSGGSKKVEIQRDEKNRFLIAYFESREVAERVVLKQHVLEEKELQLTLFNPDLDDALLSSDNRDCHVTSSSQPASQAVGFAADTASAEFTGGKDGQTAESTSFPHHDSGHSDELQISAALGDIKLKDEDIEASVEGIHHVYLKLIDTFGDFLSDISQNLQVRVVEDDKLVKLKGEKEAVKRVENILTFLRQAQTSSKYLKEVAEEFRGWDGIFEDNFENTNEYYLDFKQDSSDDDNTHVEEIYIGITQSQSSTMSFDEFLEKFVAKREVETGAEGTEELVSSKAWEEIENDVQEMFGQKIQVELEESRRKIYVRGSVKHLEEAVSYMDQFLLNAPDHQTIVLSSKQNDFLMTFCSDTLKSVKCERGLGDAQIERSEHACQIKGLRRDVRRAMKELKKILDQLKCKRAIFTHPKLEHIRDKEWEMIMQQVASNHRCIVSEFPDPAVLDCDDDDGEWGQWRATFVKSFVRPGPVSFCHVVQGKVEDMKVDAVVLCHGQQNAGGRPVSHSEQEAGARPKNSSGSMGRQQSSIQIKGTTVHPSGALPCRALIQVNLAHYFQPQKDVKLSLEHLMADLVDISKDYHFHSLALPLLGKDVPLGSTRFPIDIAAEQLVFAIREIITLDPHGSLNQSGERKALDNVFLCSPKAACVYGLIYALEGLDFKPMLHPDVYHYLSCSSRCVGERLLKSDTITVTTGDITRVKADVLVVPLNIDIDLDLNQSQITRSLLQQGGDSVQHSVRRANSRWPWSENSDERNEELAETRVIVGGPGNLPARSIYYIYVPPWGPGALEILAKIMQKCLLKASKDKLKSMAIPALGIGKLGYPPDFAARVSIAAVADFMQNEKNTVENVKFVILRSEAAIYESFSHEHNEWHKHSLLMDGNNLHGSSVDPHKSPGTSSTTLYSFCGALSPAAAPLSDWEVTSRRSVAYSERQKISIKAGQIRLSVKRGNILHEPCSVMVHNSNADFDFDRGSVARALKKLCGNSLLSICHNPDKKKRMKANGLVMTEAPNLRHCQNILHLDLARYIEKPEKTIKDCFDKIKDKLHKEKALVVAFPALGTGESGNNSPEGFASHMVHAIQAMKKAKNIEEVRIVVKSCHIFQRLASTVDPLDPSASRPATSKLAATSKLDVARGPKSFPKPNEATSSSAKTAKTDSYRPMELAQIGESVCLKGYNHDLTVATKAKSLYLFSDSEDCRQAAKDEIASCIVKLLGPVEKHQNEKKRTSSGPDQKMTEMSAFYPNEWVFSF